MQINFYLCCDCKGDAVPLTPLPKGESPLWKPIIINYFDIPRGDIKIIYDGLQGCASSVHKI